ncbi:hypothetical protein JMUB7533_26970 [Staphylococcus aureus]
MSKEKVARFNKQHFVVGLKETLKALKKDQVTSCLLYTSPSPRDMRRSRMPSSA